VGASSLIWARKHNSLHHTYTNLEGHDDDLDVGFWARLSPRQKRHGFHRLQHIYLWGLYTILVPKWQFYDDFKDLLRGKVGSHRLLRPKGWDLVQFIGGKAVFLFIAFVLPCLYHPIGTVLLFYAITMATTGFVLSVVFQLAHVVEEAQFPEPDLSTGRVSTPWAIHQLQTTVDFARRNRALSWFIGGLNFQVEHHLFPRICHLHYPKVSRIVEKACRKAGIRYYAFPNLSSAIRSHYRWLKRMGPGPEAGQQAVGAEAAA
ncbi:MAG: fatty acid desaturase family protein, partial [Planctomycetota bacterium]